MSSGVQHSIDVPDILSYHDHRADEELSNRRAAIRERVKRAIDEGHEAQSRGDYDTLATIIADVLEPTLTLDTWTLQRYHQQLAFGPYGWDMTALRSFLADPDWYRTPPSADEDNPVARARGRETPIEMRRRTLDAVFESLESVAIVEGFLPSDLEEFQPAYEYTHQIGERYLRADSNAGGNLELIDRGDWKATLLAGGQGSGKSTSGNTILEDRYAIGNKIIDLVDLNKGENVTHDIPDKSDLKEVRREMGLDIGFEEMDQPEMEILVPLTRELEDARVPFDVSGDGPEPVPRVFTIPASELTYRQLVMLLPHTTPTHENHLQSAHQKLNRKRDDWTLADLAEEVRADPKAGDKVSDRIESSLRTVQNKSFIRDKKCDHRLEWGPIMRNADVITAFTLFQIRERIDKLLIISYLIDSLFDARHKILRQGLSDEFPPMTIMMREMHEVAPRNKAEQDSESAIEGLMVDNLSKLFSLMRHVDMEIVADTQKFHRQLHPSVSELFHRFYVFGGQKPDIEKIFRTQVNPDGNPEEKIAKFTDGKCALVSGFVGGYKMPIQFAPPRHHHLDAKEDGDGFSFRANTLENEELRKSEWNVQVPDRLKFEDTSDPVIQFFEKFLTYSGDKNDYTVKREITDAYNDWADVNGYKIETHDNLHSKLVDHFDLDQSERRYRPKINGKKTMSHRCIRMHF